MGSVESVVEAVQYKTVQDITVQCSAVQERKERAEQRGEARLLHEVLTPHHTTQHYVTPHHTPCTRSDVMGPQLDGHRKRKTHCHMYITSL